MAAPSLRAAWSKFDPDGEGFLNVEDLPALVAELGAGKLGGAALSAAEAAMAPREGVIAKEDFVAYWASARLVPGSGAAAGGGGAFDDEEEGGAVADDEGDGGVAGGGEAAAGQDAEADAAEARFRRAAAAERLRARQRAAGDIFAAAWSGDLEVVEAFLRDDPTLAGAEDCFPEEAATFRKAEWQGMWEGEPPVGEYNTPLHYAAQQGHVRVMAALLGARERVVPEGGGAPFERPACSSGVDPVNFAGVTPLFLAAQQGQAEAVAWLLSPPHELGVTPADATRRDPAHGLSALDVADGAALRVFQEQKGAAWGAPAKLRAAPTLEQPRATSLLACWGQPPPPADAGGAARLPLSGFKVKVSPADAAGAANAPAVVLLAPATASSLRVEGLAPGVEYVARVAAANVRGAAPYSEPSAALGTGDAPPSLRGVLAVASVGGTAVSLTWQFSRVTGMAAIERFVLEKQEGGSAGEWEAVQHPPKEAREFAVEGLAPLTKYRFRLAAENRAGVGRFCAPVSIATTREDDEPDDGSDDEPTTAYSPVRTAASNCVAGPAMDSDESEYELAGSHEFSTSDDDE